MTPLPLLLRIISDTATITALLMIALFHLLDRDKSSLHFAGFSAGFAGYVFFDNTLSLLVFSLPVAARINTVGVAICSFVIMLTFLLFVSRIMGIPRDRRGWMAGCLVPAAVSLFFSPTALLYGWEWYMRYVDRWAIALYLFVLVYGTGGLLFWFIRKRVWRDRRITLLLLATWLMIPSLFVYRILFNINTAHFYLNNFVLTGGMAFLFPVFLAARKNTEFRELQRLRDEKERADMKKAADLHSLFVRDETLRARPGHREIQVCEGLLDGLEYKEIADRLDLSLSGVKKRVHSLYIKLGVQNRTELYNRIARLREDHTPPTSRP